jgi:exonuclease VII small subunit
MSAGVKELEDALKGFEDAEAYFETAYLTYRLARRHLDEAEALIASARRKVEEESRQTKEQLND